ncbi:hypothetical protein [Bradyrhizobium sp. 141]|uniref:hypothetical protein n=1 Tax=Bradyrhizobium sp. 141 TaxID=2782617 RepID=UPI001FF8484C|nr:hypothetical protein [Bradyrhizobium sp. 141]MCK1718864.1 hypothetical protein [Bradyrhizobium sp. 141]
MGAAATAMSGVSAVTSLASGIMQGEGEQAADEYKSAKAKKAAEYARTAATQTDAQMRENLNVQLENIDAIRAASHADPNSPTSIAIKDRTSMIGDRSRNIQVGNIMAQAAQDEADAQYFHEAGDFALKMGYMSGISGAAGKFAQMK